MSDKDNAKYFAICKHCELYNECNKNQYKHPLTKHKLPVYSYVVFTALDLYNKIKIGYTFSAEELRNTSHKVIKMLEILTDQQNKNNVEKITSKE